MPDGYEAITCPTDDVWLVSRYYVDANDPDGIQEQVDSLFHDNPLGPQDEFPSANKQWDPTNYPLVEQLNITDIATPADAVTMYTHMNAWLTSNGWGPKDPKLIEEMTTHGLGPGRDTNWETRLADHPDILDGIKAASAKITEGYKSVPTKVAYGLDNIYGAFLWVGKQHTINVGHIHAFGQTPGVGDQASFSLGEGIYRSTPH